MEYQRTTDGAGTVYQWVDSTLHVVMDLVTGELQRLEGGISMGTQAQCLDLVRQRIGWETRFIILKLDCIRAFKVERS